MDSQSEIFKAIRDTPIIFDEESLIIKGDPTVDIRDEMSLEFVYDSRIESDPGIVLPFSDAGEIVAATDYLKVPPNITFSGWKLQFRGPETHSLGTCVKELVKHFNVEVMRQNIRGGWDYKMNVHLGSYVDSRKRRCFVLWNNEKPVPLVCITKCIPSKDDLKGLFEKILALAAVVVGVVIATWIIAEIAALAVAAVFAVLIAL